MILSGKYKIGVVGYFGYETKNVIFGGQLKKTRYFYELLNEKYGDVLYVDTSNWKKNGIGLFFRCLKIAFNSKYIIILPNRTGMKVIIPLFAILKKFLGIKLCYPVVGGWLTSILDENILVRSSFKSIDIVFPETYALKNEIEKYTNSPIFVLPSFSMRNPIDKDKIKDGIIDGKFCFCTFSRVIKQKGIEEAVEGILKANDILGRRVCKLSILGKVDKDYENDIHKNIKGNEDIIELVGYMEDDEVIEVLSNNYMLIFPTYYPGEGFPATIVESYMAGVPVIASDWRFNKELVEEGVTGVLVPIKDSDSIARNIVNFVNDKSRVKEMKVACYNKAKEYTPAKAMKVLYEWIESS